MVQNEVRTSEALPGCYVTPSTFSPRSLVPGILVPIGSILRDDSISLFMYAFETLAPFPEGPSTVLPPHLLTKHLRITAYL